MQKKVLILLWFKETYLMDVHFPQRTLIEIFQKLENRTSEESIYTSKKGKNLGQCNGWGYKNIPDCR